MSGWLARPAAPGRRGVAIGLGAAIVSGLLWTLSAQPFAWWPLAWVAALPVAWVIDRAPTPRRAGLWGGAAALVFTVGGFHWMTYLLRVNAHLPTPVAWLGLVILAAYHGAVFLVGARLTRALRDRRRDHARGPWPMALCLPLGFVVVEVVIWTPFPFSLALGQAEVAPLRHLAAAASTVGIVALMTGFAGAIYDAATRARRRWHPALGVVAFAAVLALGSIRWGGGAPTRTLRVGVVQPNARVDVELHMPLAVHRIGQLRRATRALEDAGADLVVWSETAFPLDLPRDLAADNPRNHPLSIRGTARGPLVIGAVTSDDRGTRWNSAIVVAPEGAFVGRQDKIHRMIGSEYNPIIETFPSLAKYLPEGAGSYAGGDRVSLLRVPVRGGDVQIGVLICLEDVVPSHGRELAALDPDLLVNLTNDTWFDLDAEPHQHEALARFRAVEVGVPLVRAVNTGPSSVIDVDGAIVARTATRRDDPPTTLLVEVPIAPRLRSLYAAIGGWLTWGVALGALGWWLGPWLVAWRQRRKRACCA